MESYFNHLDFAEIRGQESHFLSKTPPEMGFSKTTIICPEKTKLCWGIFPDVSEAGGFL